jgi:hypothetical protein
MEEGAPMINPTMQAIRDYAATADVLPTFAQTHAAVQLDWPNVRVGACASFLPAGTFFLASPNGGAAEIFPNGEVRHAAVYNVD